MRHPIYAPEHKFYLGCLVAEFSRSCGQSDLQLRNKYKTGQEYYDSTCVRGPASKKEEVLEWSLRFSIWDIFRKRTEDLWTFSPKSQNFKSPAESTKSYPLTLKPVHHTWTSKVARILTLNFSHLPKRTIVLHFLWVQVS